MIIKQNIRSILSTGMAIVYGATLGLVGSNNAHAVLAQAPLEVSSIVEPNVMLLLDNSSSMSHPVWDDGYDNTRIYPRWDGNQVNWLHNPLETTLSNYRRCNNIRTDGMASSVRGTVPTVPGTAPAEPEHRCLIIPAPEGNNTLYRKNYMNYLFETYSQSNTDVNLVDGPAPDIPNQTLFSVVLDSARELIQDRPNIRFCLAIFDGVDGANIIADCGAATSDLIRILESSSIGYAGATPLAESFFEIMQYFRGTGSGRSFYTDTSYHDEPRDPETFIEIIPLGLGGGPRQIRSNGNPVQYRCQANYLIPITDGYPRGDIENRTNIDTSINRYTEGLVERNSGEAYRLPDWDFRHPPVAPNTPVENLPAFSDGFNTRNNDFRDGNQIFIDDLALFLREIDLHRDGSDLAGKPFGDIIDILRLDPDDDPDEFEFVQQNIITYPVGFTTDYQALADTAVHGGTSTAFHDVIYQQANDPEELAIALGNAINSILEQTGSAAATTATTTFLSKGDQIFQATYNSVNWTGKLLSFEIEADPESPDFGQLIRPALWDASEEIPAFPNRKILTVGVLTVGEGEDAEENDIGKEFLWDNLSIEQQAAFFAPGDDVDDPNDIAQAQQLMRYILGDRANEIGENGSGRFRQREQILGDIIHADPVYVADQDFDYDFENYDTFVTTTKATREKMVYVGANDGFLHGFYAPDQEETPPGSGDFTFPSGAGAERFAFAPKSVFGDFRSLADPNYQHRYLIDGKPIVIDAYVTVPGSSNDAWHSILVSPLGAGHEGLFALNVTDPQQFDSINIDSTAAQLFLWEVTNEFPVDTNDNPLYPDMGHILDRASVVRVKRSLTDTLGRWYVLAGNGVYSDSEKSVLYAININDSKNRLEVILDGGAGGGIIANTAVDVDGDDFVDRVYLTDVKGNIWRLDWDIDTQTFITKYGTEASPKPLFSATVSSSSDFQNISTAVEVGRFPGNTEALMVYFGTGKYYEVDDATPGNNFPKQTFYGILDNGYDSEISKSDLQQQTFIVDSEARVVSNNDVDFAGEQRGWFIDLPTNGERVIFEPILLQNRILFTTFIPNLLAADDPCLLDNETGWVLGLDAITGANPSETVFDTNEDGNFNDSDTVALDDNSFSPAGVKSSDGAPLPPSFIRIEPGDGQDGEIAGFSTDTQGNSIRISNPATIARTSWRRL